MNKPSINAIDYLAKKKYNKNFTKNPRLKNNFKKEDLINNNNSKSRSGSMSKDKKGNSNSKKKYIIYSNSINDKSDKNNIYKNYDSKNFTNIYDAFNNKISNSIGNIKDINYYINNSNINNFNNNISSHNFYNKKINQILYDENNKSKYNTDSNNNNFVNKTQSLIHNNSGTNNNKNKKNGPTSKEPKNSPKKNYLDYISYKRSNVPLNKKIYEKKSKNRGKPMSLLENNSNKHKRKNNNSNINYQLNNNNHINITQFNNYSKYNNYTSNNFNKRNVLSNITYSNEHFNINNNLLHSQNNESSPISMKYQISKINNKTPSSNKEIKKSQSLSHLKYSKKQNLSSKKINRRINFSKSGQKNRSKSNHKGNINNSMKCGIFKGFSNHKNMMRNKTANFNLNINNFNNFNKYLNYNLIKSSSSYKKNPIIGIKYPVEESKSLLYKDNINEKNNNINNSNRLPEEYKKDPLFIEIKNLWNILGGISLGYQELFINYSKVNENKNIIYINEINELSLILNKLNKLNKDIQKRNQIINKIKMINDDNIINNFDEMKKLLISLRIISIDIIYDYILFFKEISYDVLLNKFDLNKIKNFNKNYLKTMKNDTNFLMNNKYLNKIFCFSKNDPFLIIPSLSKSKNNNDNKYLALPIDNETFQKIKKCQYILLKEKISNHIMPMNNLTIINGSSSAENINFINKSQNNNQKENKCINSYNNTNNNADKSISKFNNIYNSSKDNLYHNYFNLNNTNNENKEEKKSNKNDEKNNLNQDINNKISDKTFNKELEIKPEIKNKIETYIPNNSTSNYFSNFDISPLDQKVKKNIYEAGDNLQIYPYESNNDKNLSEKYNIYLNSVNENVKKSFNINNDIFYYSNIGIYPKLLLFKDNNFNIKGICTISFNQNINSTLTLNKKILTITSISCSNGYKISNILLNLIEFCKNKEILFDSIEINLYYIKNEDGKFILNKELEEEIKNEAKFKWVRLENDGEKRKIKYHYVPNNILTDKENSISNNMDNNTLDTNCNKYAIYLNNYALIKYYKDDNNTNITKVEHAKLYFIINILKKYFLLNNNNDEQEIENILANFKGIKLKKIIRILSEYNNVLETNNNNFKTDYYSNENCNVELLYSFLEIIEKNKKDDENDTSLCLNFCNIFTNFSNIIKLEIDGYEYNVISMNDYIIEAFNINNNEKEEDYNNFNIYDNNNEDIDKKSENNTENEVLYFTKSESENISLIFYELKEQNNNNKDENYIKLLFNKVLKKILTKDSEEPIKSYKKICIPSFIYKKRNSDLENKNENEDKYDELNLMNYDILDCSESFDFCIENLSYNNIKFSFPLNKNINDNDEIKIIKNNFVVAILNPDLILDYHLPSLNIYYIPNDKWIKVKK